MSRKLFLVGMTIGLIILLARPTFTQNGASQAPLVGSWEFALTPGPSPILPPVEPPIQGLATFTSDGSMTEADSTEFVPGPGQTTPGHGIWQPSPLAPAVAHFFVRFVCIVPNPDAWHTAQKIVTMTVALSSNGSKFTGGYTYEVVEPWGQVISTGSGTVTGQRIVHPLLPYSPVTN